MSALPPKADIRQRIEHVRFVPKADISARPLFLVVSRTTPRFVCLGSPADIGSISAIRFTPRLQRYSASKRLLSAICGQHSREQHDLAGATLAVSGCQLGKDLFSKARKS